jgi:hypothetical protein
LSRAGSALVLLIGAAVLPGCGAPTNLTEVADDLQTTLMSMPGVTDAWVYPDESYAEGFTFNIIVDAPTATRSQLIAVADRIADTRIRLIASYTQKVDFWVTSDKPVTVRRESHIDSAQIADDAERLRVIAAGADGRIDWFRGDDGTVNQLSVAVSHTPGADLLDTVRRTAGDTGLTMTVSPASPSPRTPRMSVVFPLSAQAQTSVQRFLGNVPVDVFGLRIDNDRVRALQAMVPADPALAEQELSTVIDASRAVAAGPMLLAWYVPSAVGGVPMFGGLVEVGDCSAAAAHARQVSLRPGHDDTFPLPTRLQSTVGTCTGPEASHTDLTSPMETVLPSPPSILVHAPAQDTSTPVITRVTRRSIPAATGGSTSHATLRPPVPAPPAARLPKLPTPLPAAGLGPTAPPVGGTPAAGPNGPPHSPTGASRPMKGTARSGR